MDLVLTRKQFRSDGVYSKLQTSLGDAICETLEHAYYNRLIDAFLPKIPDGYYLCKRGKHELHNMTEPFETFEITEVPEHTRLLFHWGNYNKDSEGCVLVGSLLGNTSGMQMLTNSRLTFKRFMELQADCDSFYLLVNHD